MDGRGRSAFTMPKRTCFETKNWIPAPVFCPRCLGLQSDHIMTAEGTFSCQKKSSDSLSCVSSCVKNPDLCWHGPNCITRGGNGKLSGSESLFVLGSKVQNCRYDWVNLRFILAPSAHFRCTKRSGRTTRWNWRRFTTSGLDASGIISRKRSKPSRPYSYRYRNVALNCRSVEWKYISHLPICPLQEKTGSSLHHQFALFTKKRTNSNRAFQKGHLSVHQGPFSSNCEWICSNWQRPH